MSICRVSSSSSSVTCCIVGAWICHIALEDQVQGWHMKMDRVLWYHRFLMWGFVLNPKPLTLIVNPSLLPLNCVAHLLAIQSTKVGSSLRSWIRTCAHTTHCDCHRLLSPIHFAFYISLEAGLFWIWDWAPWNWYCYRTLPSIVDEDIEATFHALDDNGDFKVHFCTPIFYYYKYLISN